MDDKLLINQELIDFINDQNPCNSTKEIYEGIALLKKGLKDFKKDLSMSLPDFFMGGDLKNIEKLIQYGKWIDESIESLKILNFKSIAELECTKEDELAKVEEKKSDSTDSLELIVTDDTTFCPKCNVSLGSKTVIYTAYSDKNKAKVTGRHTIKIYHCKECEKDFIKDVYAKQLEQRFTNVKLTYPETGKCIQCGESVWNNSWYCWEHYKYHNAESK